MAMFEVVDFRPEPDDGHEVGGCCAMGLCGSRRAERARDLDEAQRVARQFSEQNPGRRFAYTDGAIGVWSDEAARFVMCCGRAITNGRPWVTVAYELRINGELPVKAEEWREI